MKDAAPRERRKRLVKPGANLPTVAIQANTAAFEQIGDGGDGLAVVLGDAAHGEDKIAETRAAGCFLQGFFHKVVRLGLSLKLI